MMNSQSVQISADALKNFVHELFLAADVAEGEAAEVAGSLVESNLRGHESHGVLRVHSYLDQLRTDELRSGMEWGVLAETPAVLVADGRRGFGQVLSRRLVEHLAAKCQSLGIACG